MSTERIKELEEKIADLKARWPAHSVPPSMWRKLEELEDELEKANCEGVEYMRVKYELIRSQSFIDMDYRNTQ